jgi:hypothetical protein
VQLPGAGVEQSGVLIIEFNVVICSLWQVPGW